MRNNKYKKTHKNLVMSFLLNRRSYWAEIASDATNEQSDTIVWQQQHNNQLQHLNKFI